MAPEYGATMGFVPAMLRLFAIYSQVVTEYLNDAGLMGDFEKVVFYLVGYGCTTCIGNSGTSHENITKAAKGTLLLGVKAVIAKSYERIHRSNLIGMGVLPFQFMCDDTIESLGLDDKEEFSITGIAEGLRQESVASQRWGQELPGSLPDRYTTRSRVS